MIRFITGGLAAAMAWAMIATTAAPALGQTVLRYADYGPNRGTRAAEVEKFLQDVEARTEGRVRLEPHWGGALLGATKMLDGLSSGVTSLGVVTAAYFPTQLFGYRVGDLPIRNSHEVAGALALYDLASTNEQLKAEFDRANVVFVANFSVGPVQLICKGAPVRTLDDLKGRKVRYVADYGKIFAEFGAVPVALPFSEAYQGLDTGLIDCSQTYGYTTRSYRLHEVGDHFLVLDWGTIQSNAIFMNKDAFEGLSAEDQRHLLAAGRALTESNARAIREENQAVIRQLPEGIDGHKVSVSWLSDADRARLDEVGSSDAFAKAWIEESGKYGLDGAAILTEYQALLEKHGKMVD